jgi:hypothetical protein
MRSYSDLSISPSSTTSTRLRVVSCTFNVPLLTLTHAQGTGYAHRVLPNKSTTTVSHDIDNIAGMLIVVVPFCVG